MRSIRWIILMSLLAAGCAPAASRLPTSQPPRSASPIIPAAPTAAIAAAPTATALPTRTSTPEVTPVPAGPLAPVINNTVWINTEPLTPDQLNGRVVLIDFWTFG